MEHTDTVKQRADAIADDIRTRIFYEFEIEECDRMIEIYSHKVCRLRPFAAWMVLPEGRDLADTIAHLFEVFPREDHFEDAKEYYRQQLDVLHARRQFAIEQLELMDGVTTKH